MEIRNDSGASPDPGPRRPRRSSRRPLVVAVGSVAVAVVTVVALRSDPPAIDEAVAVTSTVRPADGESPPPTGAAVAGLRGEPIESKLPWPAPPADHAPHVLTSPGDGPFVDDADGLALVYVNSIGRPTFLDLATGDRTEIEVSPERVVDRIALGPDGFETLRLPGPDAIVVVLHRPTLLAGWSGEDEPGLHMCLTGVCAARRDRDRLVLDRQRIGDIDMRVQRLDESNRRDVAALVAGPSATRGRFRLVDTPTGPARVPAPGAGQIWLVVATGAIETMGRGGDV